MKLIITIDTEEDSWDKYSATKNPVENIERIIHLQKAFDEFRVKPTYLVSYPVATNTKSVTILKKILDEGKCEIGMHCHPWNTPPFDEKNVINAKDTMLCNLNDDLVFQKMATLHEAICKRFGVVPISFRAGRWSFSPGVARSLCRLSYRIDTSVTPYTNWENCHGINFSSFSPHIFKFNEGGLSDRDLRGALLEVPATVGFLQKNFKRSMQLTKIASFPSARKIRLKAILSRLRLLNQAWLSPEIEDVDTMIRLSKRMENNNFPCLNMVFHSTSLLPGASPFVKSKNEATNFIQKIRDFLVFADESGYEPKTLSQFGEAF